MNTKQTSIIFHVKKVEVARGPFWTVLKSEVVYDEDGSQVVVVGGDHHWLSQAGAEAAKRVYEIDPKVFDMSPTEVMKEFNLYFHEEWPLVEAPY